MGPSSDPVRGKGSPRGRRASLCLCASLLWGGVPGFGTPAGTASEVPRESPKLVIVGSAGSLGPIRAILPALLDLDESLEAGLRVEVLEEDAPGRQAKAQRVRQELQEASGSEAPVLWALLDPRGAHVAQGAGAPLLPRVAEALANEGPVRRTRALKAFLREHPDHLEAAADLANRLGALVRLRLRQAGDPAQGPLDPAEDTRIWGSFASALGPLLEDEMAMTGKVSLDRLVPPADQVRRSPRMMGLFRRSWPGLASAVRRDPECGPLLANALHVCRVLGPGAASRLLGPVAWYWPGLRTAAPMPVLPVAESLVRDLDLPGEREVALATLERLWWEVARPKLQFFDKAWLVRTNPQSKEGEALAFQIAEREEVWKRLLAPMIQALVRSGRAAEVPPLLQSLDDTWEPLALGRELKRLAVAIGHADLGRGWADQVATLPGRVPREGLIGKDVLLVHQGQGAGAGDAVSRFLPAAQAMGVALGWLEATEPWRRKLGWPPGERRWALVDGRGALVRQGQDLAEASDLRVLFEAAGLQPEYVRATAFLRVHPDHLGARLSQAERLAWILQGDGPKGGVETGAPGASWPGIPGEAEAWPGLLEAFERLLGDPLVLSPRALDILWSAFPSRARTPEAVRPEATRIAGRFVPQLTAALARWPGEESLWRAWIALATHLDPFPLETLLQAPRSPFGERGFLPRPEILHQAALALRREQRWDDLVRLAEGSLRGASHEGPDPHPPAPPKPGGARRLDPTLLNLLIEGYTHLGQPEAAARARALVRGQGGVLPE